MKTSDFDYHLPPEIIAQTPAEPRDHSRLLVLDRKKEFVEHRRFHEIGEFLEAGDLLVCNNSRVIPARLYGHKVDGGGKVELLLLRRLESGSWEALARPGRRLREGARIEIGSNPRCEAQVLEKRYGGKLVVALSDEEAAQKEGVVPLPPYIHVPLSDPERYQTVYCAREGSVAAPTAGLHVTPELMARLRESGVRFTFITLHLGLDSFRPVQVEDPREHELHREYFEIPENTADAINQAKREGRRVICVGTSSVRSVEQVAGANDGVIKPFSGWADLFILPGYRFQVVDAMITNFHLPRSSHLMLVSALAGRELVLKAYAEAMQLGYRFYSFGDAMLVL